MGAVVLLFMGFVTMVVGLSTEQTDGLSLPLVDNMKAALTANIDVSSLNNHIKNVIQKEVKKLRAAIQDTITNFTNEVNDVKAEMKEVKAEMEQANKDYANLVYTNFSNFVESKWKQMEENLKSDSTKDIHDCTDIKGSYDNDTIIRIYPNGKPGFLVYCDMITDGGGWTVFQHRFEGSVKFTNKLWVDYANGFGNISSDFWLGNEKLHLITSGSGQYEMRIDLKDWDDKTAYIKYEWVTFGDASSKYLLRFSEKNYTGTAGNALSNNVMFTTIDNQNDQRGNGANCANYNYYGGGWWYNSGCGFSTLNGNYIRPQKDIEFHNKGSIFWSSWRDFSYSLKETKMMIRRK